MSKIEELKNMSRASEASTAQTSPSGIDQTRVEAHLRVLSLPEETRIKNSQELIQRLKELQSATSRAANEIGGAARQVRDYPAEVVNQHATRMEQCLSKCEAAAAKSKDNFDKTCHAITDFYNDYFRNLALLAFCSSMATAIILLAILKITNRLSL